MSNTHDVTEFENIMSLDNPIKSTTATRWERKHMIGSSSSASSMKHSSCSSNDDQSMDRFIPNRSSTIMSMNNNNDNENCNCDSEYGKLLQEVSHGSSSTTASSRILAFKNKAPIAKDEHVSSLKVLYSVQGTGVNKPNDAAKVSRHIPSAPTRILDAPELLDDYYLNLMSWGSSNVLAVALAQTVYLWDASTGNIKELMSVEADDDYVSSVSWIQQGGSHIAIGTASNCVQLWDVQAGKQVRSMSGHTSRVGALAWNDHILSSGSRDTTILNHDVRVQQHIVGRMTNHTQEVCGLSWSPDGNYLASGANDNTLCIYDGVSASPKHIMTDHQAAVKALAWSPHERNLLASGGGTADRCIKFWNASLGTMVNSIDTGSQVCALQWSPYEKEILSSHGYAENQLCLWKYPSMAKIKEFKGHTARVLHLASSPDGSLVCSGAADETLRFWNIFASEGKRKSDTTTTGTGSLSRSTKLCLR